MAQGVVDGPDPWESSSISVYIGIPTEEFRRTQSDIAALVGQVLTIAHRSSPTSPDPWSDEAVVTFTPVHDPQHHLPLSYQPLLRGATSYVSVFGYWTGGGRFGRRVDDHTEVLEFMFRPRELGVATALVLAEVVFPSLFCARQDETLVLIRDGGKQYQVSVVRAAPSVQPRVDDESTRLGPIEFAHRLVRLCERTCSPGGHVAGVLQLEGTSRGLFQRMETTFEEWCDSQTTAELPTIKHRLLTIAATWLLFNSMGPADDPGVAELHESNGNLHRLRKWMDVELADKTQQWIRQHGGHDRDDPVVNGFLWLAFTADYLEWYFGREAPVKEKLWSAYDRFIWVAEQVGPTPVGCSWRPPTLGDPWGNLLARLDFMRSLNDSHFPDEAFMAAWALLASMLAHPWSSDDALGNAPGSRKWSPAIEGASTGNLAGWTKLLRSWNHAPATARMWLSPLVLDAVHQCISTEENLSKRYRGFFPGGKMPVRAQRSFAGFVAAMETPGAPGQPPGGMLLGLLAAFVEAARFGYPFTRDSRTSSSTPRGAEIGERRADPLGRASAPPASPPPPLDKQVMAFIDIVRPPL